MKSALKFLFIVFSLLCFSCEGELEDCYDTVCTGPDNTDCREEPNFGSGCFPVDNGMEPASETKINE